MKSFTKKKIIFILIGLMLIGALLRFICCYWGYPYQLHPDESTIVNGAINMISRHSWEVNVYNRPDHFEIKCCALLFQIVSYLKYGVSADVAFAEHTMTFYLVARGYTVIFGTIMIVLMYFIAEKILKKSGLIVALLTTFVPVFVEHSAYSTPNIVLATIVLMITYISILYIEEPSTKKLILMCIATGIGITVKYTCAIACLWIAIVVIYDAIKNKQYFNIFKHGILAISIVLLTTFFMAPNLFTNIEKTIDTLQTEARSTHLGADGLGFWGNMNYYFSQFFSECTGAIFSIIGTIYLLKQRKAATLSFGMGLLFLICTSILPLHWERWGMPIYVFIVLLIGIGMRVMFTWTIHSFTNGDRRIRKLLLVFGSAYAVLCCISIILSGISTAKLKGGLTNARILALEYCLSEGITEENTIYDGYTPFKLSDPSTISIAIDETTGELMLTEKQAEKEYIIISSQMYNRYYAEEERYADTVAMYDAIQEQCELIIEFAKCDFSVKSSNIITTILNNIYFIFDETQSVGPGNTQKIYRINS